MIRWLLAYVLLVNLVAFCLCGVDKRRAKKGRWRIAERTLLTAALLGGSPGLLLGMRAFHHKTRHKKFTVGVPLLLLRLRFPICPCRWGFLPAAARRRFAEVCPC